MTTRLNLDPGWELSLAASYAKWLGVTALLYAVFLALAYGSHPTVSSQLHLLTKAIKIASFYWMSSTIRKAMADLQKQTNTYNMEVKLHKITAVFMEVFVLGFIIQACYIAFFDRKVLLFGAIVETALSLGPVAAMAGVNVYLSRAVSADRAQRYRMFFCFVDLPCLVAALTLIGVALCLKGFLNEATAEDLSILLQGAMAFLVLTSYVVDKMVHSLK